jgi:cation:H+ antiporter
MDHLLLLLGGLVVLIIGGELLVRGAVGIALKFNISTLVIGMTVVSFGTSAPELIVSLGAAAGGNPEIAIGNVIGSNIANIALVLAITVLIFPIVVDRNSIRIDWPVMMLASVLFYIFALDNSIQLYEGITLFTLLLVFIIWLVRNSRKQNLVIEDDGVETEEVEKPKPLYYTLVLLLIGLVCLYFGAEWLLGGAVGMAESYGMEKHLIAVTIVAFGTSVPELVTSGVAAYRKQTDISVGNLIGSNLFNIMAVIGITAMVKPIPVEDEVVNSDVFWMLGIAAVLLPMMLIGKKMGRMKGVMLLTSYLVYIGVLIYYAKSAA